MKLSKLVIIISFFLFNQLLAETDIGEIKIVEENSLVEYFTDKLNSAGIKQNEFIDNPLYQTILNEFQNRYEEIGKRKLKLLENGRNLYSWGDLNHVGFGYNKSWADFSVELHRSLAPDVFDDKRWIVTDQFNIYVNASKVLSNLKENGIIEIGEKEYAAFAGVTFKRTYKHVHFANSYIEGLSLNLNKLFLGFLNFRSKGFLNLSPYEIITKEDSIAFSLGGVGTMPVYGPIVGTAGMLLKYKKLNNITIQSLGPEDIREDGEVLRIGVEKSKVKSLGISASIMADFMKILKISLLRYDFEYTLEESYKMNLSFKEEDRNILKDDNDLSQAVSRAIKGKKYNGDILAPYVVSHEKSLKEVKKSKYAFLILGSQKERQTEMKKVEKDDKLTTFFKHHFEKFSYTESFMGKMFKILLNSFVEFNSVVRNIATDNKILNIEYESEKNLLKSKDDLFFEDELQEKLSMSFMRKFYSDKTKGYVHKKKKKRALRILRQLTSINPQMIELLKNNELRGPLNIQSTFKIGKVAINYFNNLSYKNVHSIIKSTCKKHAKGLFKSYRFCRARLYKRFHKYWLEYSTNHYSSNDISYCKKLAKRKFWKSARKKRLLVKNCMFKLSKTPKEDRSRIIPVWALKKFIHHWFLKVKDKGDVYKLFGEENIFLYGGLSALTPHGMEVNSYFREGEYNGLGIIGSYLSSIDNSSGKDSKSNIKYQTASTQ